mmetsp:Transcript_126405/g.369333  ORF Transcript_126405/g.369333 Transcript_126405/m.369333 type:complete len:396 (+) Transcript_126405:120-1307(+)
MPRRREQLGGQRGGAGEGCLHRDNAKLVHLAPHRKRAPRIFRLHLRLESGDAGRGQPPRRRRDALGTGSQFRLSQLGLQPLRLHFYGRDVAHRPRRGGGKQPQGWTVCAPLRGHRARHRGGRHAGADALQGLSAEALRPGGRRSAGQGPLHPSGGLLLDCGPLHGPERHHAGLHVRPRVPRHHGAERRDLPGPCLPTLPADRPGSAGLRHWRRGRLSRQRSSVDRLLAAGPREQEVWPGPGAQRHRPGGPAGARPLIQLLGLPFLRGGDAAHDLDHAGDPHEPRARRGLPVSHHAERSCRQHCRGVHAGDQLHGRAPVGRKVLRGLLVRRHPLRGLCLHAPGALLRRRGALPRPRQPGGDLRQQRRPGRLRRRRDRSGLCLLCADAGCARVLLEH